MSRFRWCILLFLAGQSPLPVQAETPIDLSLLQRPGAAWVIKPRPLLVWASGPVTVSVPLHYQLRYTGLTPSKVMPDLCLYSYRVSTTSPACQAHVDQGLGYYYSYVWMEAARSFETALLHDPDCAMAWWGLSKALEKWRKSSWKAALKQAEKRIQRANHRERLLIRARLEEKGLIEEVAKEKRKEQAGKTLDELLILYDDDQEGWFARAQLAGGNAGIPYYKGLLMVNPLHPGANHELVHFYERFQRPALGWPYAEAYIESSPSIPHAWHMQAHLATRLGKWDKTSDRSARAVELEKAYHQFLDVPPKKDYQYSHHLEILTLSLIHDGRYQEARAIKDEAWNVGHRHWDAWFRLHRGERDWSAVEQLLVDYAKSAKGKRNKAQRAYYRATVWLDRRRPAQARPHIDTLRAEYQKGKRKKTSRSELQYWEVQGRYLCQTGAIDGGLKLLEKTVQNTVDDFRHHAWGNGSYYMEAWGEAALAGDRPAIAEEAFLEALAHDPGSVRGALGMAILCRQQKRTREAKLYSALAKRCWQKADPGRFDELRESLTARSELARGE